MAVASVADVRRASDRPQLSLVHCAGRPMYRVAKTAYGPLNPKHRTSDAGEHGRDSWGRFDVFGHRTIYGASPKRGALAESSAPLRLGISGETLRQVEKEWTGDRGYMAPGQQAANWRHERTLYKLRLPRSGWLVDITAAETIATLNRFADEWLGHPLDDGVLTTEHLLGRDRTLTTAIAGWIWHQVLADGSLPHGISYPSKHGSDWQCVAIWLRAIDDGKDPTSEPTHCVDESAIECHDPDLRHVGELYGIRFH